LNRNTYTIETVQNMLREVDYLCGRSLATTVFLALQLNRPLFLEGEAGVGKTEIALAISRALGRTLIRLQCYEGLDTGSAVYECNFPAQMVAFRTAEASGKLERKDLQAELFSEEYLISRPILEALMDHEEGPPVLLIDEIDRTDEPFEAFLLEVLSEFQVSIPELGTIKSNEPPIVILTSNRTREIHDALKRRCFYYWVDFPDFERELEIIKVKVPEASESFSREIVSFIHTLRSEELFKKPGVAESIDRAKCLLTLDAISLSPEVISDTLGALLKYQDDIAMINSSESQRILEQARSNLKEFA